MQQQKLELKSFTKINNFLLPANSLFEQTNCHKNSVYMLELPCFIFHSIFLCSQTQKSEKDSNVFRISSDFLDSFFKIIDCHFKFSKFIIHNYFKKFSEQYQHHFHQRKKLGASMAEFFPFLKNVFWPHYLLATSEHY